MSKVVMERLGLAAGIVISTLSGVVIYRRSRHYWEHFEVVPDTSNIEKDWTNFLYHPAEEFLKREPLPWLQAQCGDPCRLLHLAQSPDPKVRNIGLDALTKHHRWSDATYCSLAQACDPRTLVALARSKNADPRLFLPPPSLESTEELVEEQLQRLLSNLPLINVDSCTKYFRGIAMSAGHNGGKWKEYVWSFDGNDFGQVHLMSMKDPDVRIETFGLLALLGYSRLSQYCRDIIQFGGLQVLRRIFEDRENNSRMIYIIAKILANLSFHEDLHEPILQAGWVSTLRDWLHSSDMALQLHASKTLANLDKTNEKVKYEDGVCLMYPVYRRREAPLADVVFIHGLQGGPEFTWRQGGWTSSNKSEDATTSAKNGSTNQDCDSMSGPEADQSKRCDDDEDQEETFSYCWPRDWLGTDCPHIRVISVEYETHLSEWTPLCPEGVHKRSLHKRAADLLMKLKGAGLGERPILWVGHSMGGLLIESMLLHSEEVLGSRDVTDQSKGIVFFSVPHKGSPVAGLSPYSSYFLNPSIEVRELRQDSVELKSLQEDFTRLLQQQAIPILSFGEGRETQLPFNLKSTLIVPPDSSNPGFGHFIVMDECNHIDICKPTSESSDIYQMTLKFIRKCLPSNTMETLLLHSSAPEDRLAEHSLF